MVWLSCHRYILESYQWPISRLKIRRLAGLDEPKLTTLVIAEKYFSIRPRFAERHDSNKMRYPSWVVRPHMFL